MFVLGQQPINGYGPPSGQPGYAMPPGQQQPYGYPPPGQAYPQPGQAPPPGGYPPPAPGGPQPQQQQWMVKPTGVPGCPPGLEYLTQIDQVLVQQTVELLEGKFVVICIKVSFQICSFHLSVALEQKV